MAKYPLEWGNDLNTDDDSNIPEPSPPSTTKGYPLEFGWHVPNDPADDPSSGFALPRPTLLTGLDPDTIGPSPRLTPVQYSPEAGPDDPQLAQAKPPARQSPNAPAQQRAARGQDQASNVVATQPRTAKAPFSPQYELWDQIIRGKPDTSTQILLPNDWQTTFNPDYVKWTQEAAVQRGVPVELLARHIWKESSFVPTKQNGIHKGLGQLGPAAVQDIGLNPDTFQYFDAKSSIDATAAYLALMYKRTGSWPTAVAAYNAGDGNINGWLSGKITGYRPNGETREAVRHVFRGDPNAFDK